MSTNNSINLTQEERQMIEAMRLANQAESIGGNVNTQAIGNLLQQIEAGILVGLDSSIPSIKAKAAEYYSYIKSNGGNIHQLYSEGKITHEQINSVLADIDLAATVSPNEFNSVIGGLEAAVEQVKANKTDEELQEEINQELTELRNTGNEITTEEEVVVNDTTGSRFIRNSDGTLTPYIDQGSDEYIEATKASSDEQFMQSGGEVQESIFSGLVDK